MSYSVWSSTDLLEWIEDSGADQEPGLPDAEDVETVEVSLSLQGLPRVFVQLRAAG